MKKYVYATKNKKSGNFSNPTYELFDTDAAVEVFTISAKEAPESQKEMVKEHEVYYLGTYDTVTASFNLEQTPVFIVDLGTVI